MELRNPPVRSTADVMQDCRRTSLEVRRLKGELEEAEAEKSKYVRELTGRLEDQGLSEFRLEHVGLMRIGKKKTARIADWDTLDVWLREQGLPFFAVVNKAIKADALAEMAVNGTPMPDGVELGEIDVPRFTPAK